MRYYFSLFSILWLILTSCVKKPNHKDFAINYLREKGYVEDHTIDIKLEQIIKGINILSKQSLNKYFVLDTNYDPTDPDQILVIPFRKKNGIGTVSGFSSIENKLVFICPLQIKEFVATNSLSDSSDISGYLGIVLLHELSHFALGVSGSFDENSQISEEKSGLGELDLGTEPILMTTQKRLELKVDSVAIEMIKAGIKSKNTDCFKMCTDIQLSVVGSEFVLFGKRLLENFGNQSSDIIRDKSWSHPNLELRLAFMNYYLNPTLEKRRQIDNYLYQREIEPLNKQSKEPRIYNGYDKILCIGGIK